MFLVLGNDGKMGTRNKHKGETADVCPNFSPPGFCVEMTGVHHRIGGNGRDRSYLGPREAGIAEGAELACTVWGTLGGSSEGRTHGGAGGHQAMERDKK